VRGDRLSLGFILGKLGNRALRVLALYNSENFNFRVKFKLQFDREGCCDKQPTIYEGRLAIMTNDGS